MIATAEELKFMIENGMQATLWNLIAKGLIKINGGLLESVDGLVKIVYAGIKHIYWHLKCECLIVCEKPLRKDLMKLVHNYYTSRSFSFILDSGILEFTNYEDDDFMAANVRIDYDSFVSILNDEKKTSELLKFLYKFPYRYSPLTVDKSGETILFKMDREQDIMKFIKIYIFNLGITCLHYTTNYNGEFWITKKKQIINTKYYSRNPVKCDKEDGCDLDYPHVHWYDVVYVEKDIPLLATLFNPYVEGQDTKGKKHLTYVMFNPESEFVFKYNRNKESIVQMREMITMKF